MDEEQIPSRRLKAQILLDLREKIRNGYYPAGALLPPEVLLAKQYHVSRGTVRQAMLALSKLGLIRRQPGKGTYVTPFEKATVLPRSKTRLVGFVTPLPKDGLLVDILRGAEQVLREQDYSLIYCSSKYDLQQEVNHFNDLLSHKVSGIILFPLAVPGESEAVKTILAEQVPLVLVDRQIPGLETTLVMSDHRKSAYEGVQYLLSLGHRQIACITHPSPSSSITERIEGYEQAMREAGILPLAPIPLLGVGTVTTDNTPPFYDDEELVYIHHMLGVKDRPTALFCINDYVAIGVSKYILAKGLRIPEDIAVIGFDNNSFAQYAPVPLTTMAQPSIQIGAKAAELLLKKIAGEPVFPETVRLDTQLILRASSGGVRIFS